MNNEKERKKERRVDLPKYLLMYMNIVFSCGHMRRHARKTIHLTLDRFMKNEQGKGWGNLCVCNHAYTCAYRGCSIRPHKTARWFRGSNFIYDHG